MVSEVKLLQPRLRFVDFHDDWTQQRIGSILTDISRPVQLLDNELYQLVTVKRRNEGVVPRSVVKGKNILVKNYFAIKAGDFLISKRQVVHGANGIVPESLDNAVVSNEYLVVTDNQKITAKFWSTISKRPEIKKLYFISSYGVDIEKLVFDIADWKERSILIPELNEQQKITDFFQNLDQQIKLHQDKHNKLQQLKQAMLSKMFPKAGQKVPEVRFAGFNDSWEEKLLSAICTRTYGGGTPTTSNSSYWGGEIPWIQSSDLNEKSITSKPKKSITYIGLKNSATKLVPSNSIAIITRVGVGKLALMDKPYATSQDFLSLSNLKIGGLFATYSLKKLLGKIIHSVQGTSIKGITKDELLSNSIMVPVSIEEQEKIGQYFQNLDNLIALQQQKIDKLKNIKQACLGKMFV
ncbi:restriction endonuclease subunit S [Vibrio vulnificus]|uniref:restriction endonuclease subunit S n=1 Tax=Vibrio vulnificus TaxID=672 RepID=UPI000CD18169|nr:restriction endonuclease subunit S [Vibrio vulnificus]POC22749.1 restriction endonuclease subunit S [Vibrio vulnificus]